MKLNKNELIKEREIVSYEKFKKNFKENIEKENLLKMLYDVSVDYYNYRYNNKSLIYDNGEMMLGLVKDVKEEIKKEIAEDIDMGAVDMEELLEDLEKCCDDDIVVVDYDNFNNNGYSIHWWTSDDAIKERRED